MPRIYGAERTDWLRFHLEVSRNFYSNWPHGFVLERKREGRKLFLGPNVVSRLSMEGEAS